MKNHLFECTFCDMTYDTNKEIDRKWMGVCKQNGHELFPIPDKKQRKKHDIEFFHEPSDYEKYATMIMQNYTFMTIEESNAIMYYRAGVYRDAGEWRIKADCQKIIPDCTINKVNEVIGIIKRKNHCEIKEFNKSDFLCFDNVLLNVKTFETKDHTPDELITSKIPVKYNPELKEPPKRFLKFLKEVLATPEDIITVVEQFAYILIGNSVPFHKAGIYYGSGRNGKSTLVKIISAIIGEDNISNVSLHDLDSDRYAMARLFGKLANIHSDISKKELNHTGNAKLAIAGDMIEGRNIYEGRIKFSPFAKHIYCCNSMPDINEDTDAMWGRLMVTEFPNQFLGNNAIEDLDKIIVKEESELIIRMALENLKTLIRNHGFRYEQSISDVRNVIKIQANKTMEFLDEYIGVEPGLMESTQLVYAEYVKWNIANNTNPKRVQEFNKELKQILGIITERPSKNNPNRLTLWIGIALKKRTGRQDGQDVLYS